MLIPVIVGELCVNTHGNSWPLQSGYGAVGVPPTLAVICRWSDPLGPGEAPPGSWQPGEPGGGVGPQVGGVTAAAGDTARAISATSTARVTVRRARPRRMLPTYVRSGSSVKRLASDAIRNSA